ncbi:MAG: FmdB family zinc ribbon protein [Myxococcota bacterium]
MPIYEYRCESCGEHLEKMQAISEDPITLCPECGDEALKRLISQTSFVLKGSGWYVTDYANKGKDGGNGKSDGAAGASKTDDASKSSSDSSSSSTSSESGSKGASSGSADAA